MSVNRFDQPIGQRYVSTYVPLPFEELSAMAANKERKSNALLDAADKAKGLLNIKADPKNIAYRDKLQKEYNDQLTSISEKIVKEGYTPENRSLVNQTINSIANSPERMELEKSYQHYTEYQKDAQKNQQERKYWDKYDPYETGPKGSEEKVTPFTYQGMKTKGDYIPDMQKLIDHIAKDSGASEGYKKQDGKLIINEQGQIQKSDNSWEKITDSKVYNLAKTLAPTFFRTKDANWFIDERLGHNSGKSYENLNTEKNIDIPSEESYKDPKTGKTLTRPITKKYSERDLLEEEAAREMFRIGSPQIFSSYKQGVDLQNLSEHALGKRDELESYKNLPQYRNEATTNTEELTPKKGLNILGINTDVLDNNNNVSTAGNFSSKYTVTDAKGNKSVYYNSADAHKAAGNTGIITQQEASKEDITKKLSETYTSALNTAKMLGIKIPKDPKGGNDYKQLLNDLSQYGINQGLNLTSTEALQARIGNNVSAKILGTIDVDKNGESAFKVSPILAQSHITEQGNGARVEDKTTVAQDGIITGINYFAPEPGTFRMDAKNKAYDLNPNEQVLKEMTRNTHDLTQRVIKSRVGQAGSNDVYTYDKNNKPITIAQKSNDILTQIANNMSKDPQLLDYYKGQLSQVQNAQPIAINYSDMKQPNGSPIYQYITFQEKHVGDPNDPLNNQAIEKVVRINLEHGAVEVVSLGDIQGSESQEVQKKFLAGAYEKSK